MYIYIYKILKLQSSNKHPPEFSLQIYQIVRSVFITLELFSFCSPEK